MKLNKSLTLITCVFLFAIGSFSPALATEDQNGLEMLRKTSKAFTTVAKNVTPAVVSIKTVQTIQGSDGVSSPFEDEFFERFFGPRFRRRQEPKKRESQGSGFIISQDGYILTNNHVVENADTISVTLKDGRELTAKTIGTDPDSDVALIKVDQENLPFIELGNSDTLEIGEWVIAVGNPFGLTETVTVGVVSAKSRQVGITEGGYEDFIQTDAAINPGNSGGPLLNLEGKAIGINSAIVSQSGGYMGIGLAIPINMAKAIKDQLVKSGKVERGFIGIMMQDLDVDMSEFFGIKEQKGAVVTNVIDDSPADKAGLQKDDVIVKIGDKVIENSQDLRNIVGFTAPGEKIKLIIYRNGKQKTLALTVGSRDDSEFAKTSSTGQELGLTVTTIDKDIAQEYNLEEGKGVLIENVKSGSSADQAGIRSGMVILSVNREATNSVLQFNEALKESEKTGKALMLIRTGRFSYYFVLRLDK